MAQIGYVFFQNDFHFKLSSGTGGPSWGGPCHFGNDPKPRQRRAGFYIRARKNVACPFPFLSLIHI